VVVASTDGAGFDQNPRGNTRWIQVTDLNCQAAETPVVSLAAWLTAKQQGERETPHVSDLISSLGTKTSRGEHVGARTPDALSGGASRFRIVSASIKAVISMRLTKP
jgi:hypothetical protein